MPATFDGMTFGGAWNWEGAWLGDSTNNIYFSSPSSNKESFGFVQPEIFVSVQVFGDATGTLTLADDQGQTLTFAVAQTNKLYTVTTGWTKPSNNVTATYTQNWHLAFDNFTYQTPAAASSGPGSLAASITLTWDDGTPVAGSVVVTQISAGNVQTALGHFPLSATGTASGTLSIDLTQADPLTFQLQLVSSTNVQIGQSATFQLPKLMFPTVAKGITAKIVLWKATTTIKTFDVGLNP
jgi:hypothetical protein